MLYFLTIKLQVHHFTCNCVFSVVNISSYFIDEVKIEQQLFCLQGEVGFGETTGE